MWWKDGSGAMNGTRSVAVRREDTGSSGTPLAINQACEAIATGRVPIDRANEAIATGCVPIDRASEAIATGCVPTDRGCIPVRSSKLADSVAELAWAMGRGAVPHLCNR